MAWPPTVPPATRANATPQLDNHAADHNAVSLALTAMLPTAWTALPLGTGWSTLGGFQPAQYRLVGDVVELRGAVVQAAVGNTTLATMPAGFRPPANGTLMVFAAGFRSTPKDVAARIDITPATGVLFVTAQTEVYGYLSLAGVRWSIT